MTDSTPGNGPPEDAVPPEIVDLAASCADYVRGAVGVELDFTADTLPLLDHYVAGVRETLAGRDEIGGLVARVVGAYFGEVLRRTFGGFWRAPSSSLHDWAFCARSVFLSVNPAGVAYDALFAGTEHDGPRSQLRVAPEYREAVSARLASLPPVPEDEFYLLSTRLEAVEVAVEALRAEMVAAGYDETEFEPADYVAEELRPLGEA
jgi:hypothetical protein